MAKTYNYERYGLKQYDIGSFPGPKAGEKALDFVLKTFDGREVTLADYKGKWVVLETGSITCSMYVKNVDKISALQEKFPDVEFLLVYIREAHPGSRLKPPQNDAEKIEYAKQLKEIYQEPREVLVDNLAGDMHKPYGELPNMVYVIDPEGTVIYRCDWAFPKNVEKVLSNRDKIETNEHVSIITAPLHIMIPVVLRGGWNALWDLAIVLPVLTLQHLFFNLKNKTRGSS